MQRIYRLFDSY